MIGPGPQARSFLYVPAHRRRFVDGAPRREADAIILDLEDGVPAEAKEQAREGLGHAVATAASGGAAVWVRVNAPWRVAWRDLEAAARAGAHGVVLPKVEDTARLQVIDAFLTELARDAGTPPLALLAIIETARGLLDVGDLAAATPGLVGLIPGTEDLALSLGVGPLSEALERSVWPLILAAKAKGLAPIGTLGGTADFRDVDAFRKRVARSAALGFEGATCIHPDQVPVINDAYAPSASSLAHARRIVAAFEDTDGGVVDLDGRMVDRPVYLRARRLLERTAADDDA